MMALGATMALLAGCSSTGAGPSPSPTPSVSPVCAAADAYSSALTNFKDTLKPGVTVDQIRTARDQVLKAFDDMVSAAGDAAKDRVDAVKTAEQKFTSAVKAVPNDATLSQAVQSLRDEAANVQGAITDLTSEVKC